MNARSLFVALFAGSFVFGCIASEPGIEDQPTGETALAASACAATFRAVWQQGGGANEWWVEYQVTGRAISSAWLELPSGAKVTLAAAWGKWGGSSAARIPRGTSVVLHANDTAGQHTQTEPFSYLSDTAPDTCSAACIPSCQSKTCGDDGCGGSCGTCGGGTSCSAGACVPASCSDAWSPSWSQRGGANTWWVEYAISGPVTAAHLEVVGRGNVTLTPTNGKWVGPPSTEIARGTPVVVHATRNDGKTAKTSPFGYLVQAAPTTAPCDGACVPSCDGKTCGDDGCGGSCGTCPPDDETPTCATIFDPAAIPRFRLTMDAAAMAILSDPDPELEKTWVHASFTSGDVTLADVGVRRKGSSTYRVLPKKAALKIRFDRFVKGQTFACLTDLTLNNMMSDPTFIAERLSYHVFRSVGLPAQRANTARVTINGADYGIYANVETPDDRLLERLLGARGRSLYEMNWGSEWLPGHEDGVEEEVGDETLSDVRALFAAHAAAPQSNLLGAMASTLDTTAFLKFAATEAAVGHYDGYGYGVWGSHNYFLASDVDGRFQLLPWSTDLTMSNRAGVPDSANPRPAGGGPTLLLRCKGSSACWDTYKNSVRSVLTTYETLDLVNLAKAWHAQIDPLVLADPKREASVSYYTSETQKLYDWLAKRPGVVRVQLGL